MATPPGRPNRLSLYAAVAGRSLFLDFACRIRRIAVEVDGDHHAHQVDYDRERSRWLGVLGWQVIRVSVRDVLARPDAIADWIVAILDGLVDAHEAMAWHPAEPSPTGG